MSLTEFLKENDPDRYLLSLFIKDDVRRHAVMGLDALNVELARLRDIIDTPHMGLIRLQWWRDEIKKIYLEKMPAPHDVLTSLKEHLLLQKISFENIDALISAREADFLEYDEFDIQNYAKDIHIPLMRMKAAILGETNNVDALAEAYALIGLLRAIPFYKARSQVLIPSIQPAAVEKICNIADALLKTNQAKHSYFKAHHVLAKLYMKQIVANGYSPENLPPLAFKELRVWWGSLF